MVLMNGFLMMKEMVMPMGGSVPEQIINILIGLEECEKKQRKAIIEDIDTLNIIHEALVYYLEEILNV